MEKKVYQLKKILKDLNIKYSEDGKEIKLDNEVSISLIDNHHWQIKKENKVINLLTKKTFRFIKWLYGYQIINLKQVKVYRLDNNHLIIKLPSKTLGVSYRNLISLPQLPIELQIGTFANILGNTSLSNYLDKWKKKVSKYLLSQGINIIPLSSFLLVMRKNENIVFLLRHPKTTYLITDNNILPFDHMLFENPNELQVFLTHLNTISSLN